MNNYLYRFYVQILIAFFTLRHIPPTSTYSLLCVIYLAYLEEKAR